MKTEEELRDFLGKDLNKIEQLCRICLSEDLYNAALVSDTSENRYLANVESLEAKLNMDEELSLWEKIIVFGRVNVNHEDDLMKYVCEQCCFDIDVAYTFRVKCRKTEMLMKNVLETLGRKPCYPGIIQIKKEELHVEFVTQEDEVTAYEEEDKLDLSKERAEFGNEEVIFKNDDDAEYAFTCKVEEETDEPQIKVKNRKETPSSSTPLKKRKYTRKVELKKDLFTCDMCDRKCSSRNGILLHMAMHQEKPFMCSKCKKCFSKEETMEAHEKLHKSNLHRCEVCNKYYGTKRRLETHARTHTGAFPFACDHCEDKFNSINLLYIHKRKKHEIKKMAKCKICYEIFETREELHKHKSEHKMQFVCHVCNKSLTNAANLKHHIFRAHSVEKPLLCDFCSKGFVTRGELDSHIRTHTGERPFVCDVCSKRFGSPKCLRAHKKSTSCLVKDVERRYECGVCNKRFVTSSCMKNHMQVHTGERPFGCAVCGKRFGQKYKLQVHMRIHTGEKPFQCDLCSMAFTVKCNLMAHIKTHKQERTHFIV